MARPLEDYFREELGALHFQVVVQAAEIDKLKDELVKAKNTLTPTEENNG